MLNRTFFLLLLTAGFMTSCVVNSPDHTRDPVLEVEGQFLYMDQIQDVIPPNISEADSISIVDSYIKKWVTDILLFENAKRNISDRQAIERLLDDYRKSLIIHQYQQSLIQQRLPEEPNESELLSFYHEFSSRFVLKENFLKGILLVLPTGAPKLTEVRRWVRSGEMEDLEQIEKYSLQHGLSYDYFADRWVPFNEILKKIPLQTEISTNSITHNKFYEISDSEKHYMLSVDSVKNQGEIEPYEIAREKISNILMNKIKSEFIVEFEEELYQDAIQNGSVIFYNK